MKLVRLIAVTALAAAFAASLGACGGKKRTRKRRVMSPLASSGGVSTATKLAAKAKWDTLCVTCHGKTGAGDGPGAANLTPKPRSFSDAAWQAKTTDEYLSKVIIGGGLAVKLSQTMPPNPDLHSKPKVVAELIKIVRAFKK